MRLLLILFILVGCKTSSQDSSLKKIINQELDGDYKIELNDSKTYALAWNKNQSNVNYVVVKLSTNSIILKKVNIHAEVTWHDDLHIKEITKSGQFKKDGSATNEIKLINVNDFTEAKK